MNDEVSSVFLEDNEISYEEMLFFNRGDKVLLADDEEEQDKGMLLLNYLPNLYVDHTNLSNMYSDLLGVIIEQQKQINSLNAIIENIQKIEVTFKAQETMNQLIKELVKDKTDIGGAEVTINFTSSSIINKNSKRAKIAATKAVYKTSKNVSAGISGILDKIAGLAFNVDSDTEKLQENLININNEDHFDNEENRSGTMILKFKEIKTHKTVPGSVPTSSRGKANAQTVNKK